MLGMIGEEVQAVFPEMITAYDEKLDAADAEPTRLLAFNNSGLTYMLVTAVRELAQQVETITSRLTALETRRHANADG